MAETKRFFSEPRDYKERFEFRLTIGDNIICQRYFRIADFNEDSLNSFELADCIRDCAHTIDNDLKGKTLTYLEMVAPRIFQNEEEMFEYFKKEENRKEMHKGEGLVLRDENQKNYVWGKNDEPVVPENQFTDNEFSCSLTDEDVNTYKFSFLDNGREVISTIWDGVYPRQIRKSIDLSNKGPKFDNPIEAFTVGFESYLKYRMTTGRTDLVFKIIKKICDCCSYEKGHWYEKSEVYKRSDGSKIKYDNNFNDYSFWKNEKKVKKA